MAISDKLYELRKKGGLSQEQLAEKLNVSRQAVSKWESGQSVPESEKLLAISDYFGVSLDYLMKEDVGTTISDPVEEEGSAQAGSSWKWTAGAVFCIGGIAALLLWGMLTLFSPSASEKIAASSVIHIDGNGNFLILCVAAIVFGVGLLLKNASKK